jgi:hypothetical protein
LVQRPWSHELDHSKADPDCYQQKSGDGSGRLVYLSAQRAHNDKVRGERAIFFVPKNVKVKRAVCSRWLKDAQ